MYYGKQFTLNSDHKKNYKTILHDTVMTHAVYLELNIIQTIDVDYFLYFIFEDTHPGLLSINDQRSAKREK